MSKLISKKRILISVIVALLVFGLASVTTTFAAKSKNDELKDVRSEKSELLEEMNALSKDIEAKQKEIDDKEAQIGETEADLKAAQAELEQTRVDIEKRQDGLNKRVRAMYKNGSVGYIDILLGSGDLSELISNIDLVQRIYKSDQATLTQLEEQKVQLEESEKALTEQKELLEGQKKELDAAKKELDEKASDLQSKYNTLKKQEAKLMAEIEAQSSAYSMPTSYGGGRFIWPVSGPITGEYWQRRSYENHPGIDIGVAYGTPVKACAAGTVVMAQWYGGYGNCVMIAHGSGLYSLYGHNSSYAVSVGTKVSQGQVVAYAGSTGWSTGPHCHWEIRVGGMNGSTANPRNYV